MNPHYGPPLETLPMTDQSENLILEYLRAIRGDIAGIKGKLEELFTRMGSVEGHLARIDTHLERLGGDVLHQNARVDALEMRTARIEQRLQLQS
jgi:hypothetical protein